MGGKKARKRRSSTHGRGRKTVSGRYLWISLLVVVGAVLVIFIGFPREASSPETGLEDIVTYRILSAVDSAEAEVGISTGSVAPDFTFVGKGGEELHLVSFRGRPVVIFFMASWCLTCVPESQALDKVYQKHEDDLVIFLVDVDPNTDSEADLRRFGELYGNPGFYYVLDSDDHAIAYGYRVRSLDTTLIIDKNGVIVYKDEHPTTTEVFTDQLSKLL
ncbi:MAG: TlpA family protein disulfide reductase [Candidatus Geothermarchaeales archaeon]